MDSPQSEAQERETAITEMRKVGALGRYRLIAELARGGMGIVFLALVRGPAGFSKFFVLKELKPAFIDDPHLVLMFLEEARLAAKLSHPNVVQTIEVGSENDRHFIAMEYLDGQSLHRILGRCRKMSTTLPLQFQLMILIAALEGLHYAHELCDFDGSPLNIVHRDVSPQNVFVTYDGQIKVVDFGIAKALDSSNETRTGMLKGKIAYMAPEQAAGLPLDRRSDVFAVGVMLWEMVVGKRMWARAENDMQILHGLIQGAVPRPKEMNPDIPDELERIIVKATAVNREERHATAAELMHDLEKYLKSLSEPALGARDLGRFLSDTFTHERAQIKAVIDNQLRSLRGLTSGEYGSVDLPTLSATSGAFGTPSGISMIQAKTGSNPALPSGPPSVIVEPMPPPGRKLVIALGLGALALAGVVAFLLLRTEERLPQAAAPAREPVAVASEPRVDPSPDPPRPVTSARPPEPAAAATTVRVTVKAEPADARIYIDGALAKGNPFAGSFVKDGTTHTVRADARGRVSKSETFVADANAQIDLSLEVTPRGYVPPPPPTRVTQGDPVAPTVVAPPPPPPTSTAAPDTKTGRPTRAIDTSNPYGK